MTDIKTKLESDLRREDIKYWTPSQDDGKKKDDDGRKKDDDGKKKDDDGKKKDADGKKKDADGKKKDADGKKKDKCDICCVNKPEKTFVKLQHGISCRSKIKMCVGCLWNLRYNPVKCHSCDQEKIQSPVGDRWGAILIAGTDKKEDITKRFEDDIEKLKDRVITKATLMGVRDNVVTVKKSKKTYGEQLMKAFSNFDTSEINTLVLVYSGHHGDEGFQLDTHTLTDSELEKKIICLKHVTKVILFLDCCHPKKLNLGEKAVLQFNAVTSQQKAISEPTGSQFVNDIVKVLTNPWECRCCGNTPLIRDYDMHKYFNKHPYNESKTPSQQAYTEGDIDHILMFRPVDPRWLNKLEESLESSPLQRLRNKLFDQYKDTSIMSVRFDIDDALEKVYEEPKLTLREKKERKEVKRPIKLNNIFQGKAGTMAKTIFVEGEPGSGKSSLCKKIVHDWCEIKQRLEGQSTDEWCKMLSQFEFVFYVILREAKNECNITNMILKYIIARSKLEQESEKILLEDILETNTCLLLLDGLDEWQHPEKCTLSEKTPHVDTSWKKCILCITTRPYKLAQLKIGCSKIENHILLEGVTYPKKLVAKIVSSLNNFHAKEKSSDQCIDDIRHKKMWHFSECPILLAHIVWLWYKGKLLADINLSVLYRTMLGERWEEFYVRWPAMGYKIEFNDVIRALSKIAFEKLFAEDEKKTIVFEINEQEKTTLKNLEEALLKSGIISCKNVHGEYSGLYYFFHKSVQEYLAALFLSECIGKCWHDHKRPNRARHER
ncbi:uncharacterized protein LOC128222418 [Mya arenaria]|uniref:uncharacterized protein LOC128222418 n=1 Tax=Mya arenaria TaxID=6604 RepID=UPI0022E67FBB|nr:uncharacterized protein LOC128222418 [Mya arenaria]